MRPDLVHMAYAAASKTEHKYTIISGAYREELYPRATYGDPRRATAEKGEAIIKQAVDELVELIEDLERGELPIGSAT